jgi:hypothetical protein
MVDFAIATPRAQVALDRSPFYEWTLPDGTRSTEFYRVGSGYLLRFPGLADFEIAADGLAVRCLPTLETSDATSRHLYINQVLPLVLGRLGKMVFHASAVEIAGAALAFVAESSRGKSTLAASFATTGSPMLTDESLVVDERASMYWGMPGHPSVRLWDDSEQVLIAPGAETAPGLPFTSKRRFLAAPELRFSDGPAPLRRVYFLGDGSASTVTLEPMEAVDVMLELLKASFLLNVDDKPRLASHFDEVARLARRPIHFRLDFPRRFDLLPTVRQAVIAHAQDDHDDQAGAR